MADPPSHIQTLLKTEASNILLSGEGDSEMSGMRYYVNGFIGLLARLQKAAVADGLDRETIMRLFVNLALDVLDKDPAAKNSAAARRNRDTVLQEAMKLHSLYDDPKKAQ